MAKTAALQALKEWGTPRGLQIGMVGVNGAQQGAVLNQHGRDPRAPYTLQVSRVPENKGADSKHAPLELTILKHSIYVGMLAEEQREASEDEMEEEDGQPPAFTPMCCDRFTAQTSEGVANEHFFWPAQDLRIGIQHDPTNDKGKVVAALTEVTFAQPPMSDKGRATSEPQNLMVDKMNALPCREKAGWLTDSLRVEVDHKLPVVLRKEGNVEHQVGQVYVIKSQNPAVWEATLRPLVDAQAGTITLTVPGTMPMCVTAKVVFEWKRAVTAEKAAQTSRFEARKSYEQEVQGRKLHMTGMFNLSDSTDALSIHLQNKGTACKELTGGLWSGQAVERVEIAATGKGGTQRVGAFVVMSSKVEAELLLRLVQEKQVSWGGQPVSAFICRQWKSKEKSKQGATLARGGRRTGGQQQETASGHSPHKASTGGASAQGTIDLQDSGNFPSLPPTARWGATKPSNIRQQMAAATTSTAAATTTTKLTRAPTTPSNGSSLDAMRQQLAAEVAALRTEGEADRLKVAELTTQLQGLLETVGVVVQELKDQRRSTAAWQEVATRQMQQLQEMTRTLTAQNEAIMQALRQGTRVDEAGITTHLLAQEVERAATLDTSEGTHSKKRSRPGTDRPPVSTGANSYSALNDGEDDDGDDGDDDDDDDDDDNMVAEDRLHPSGNGQPQVEQPQGDVRGAGDAQNKTTGEPILGCNAEQQLTSQQGDRPAHSHPQSHQQIEGRGH
jgi:hypothetical protein